MGLLLGKLQNSGDQKKKEYEKLENNFDDHVTVDMISGLPDDVTIDVLSRLPAEQVWELGKVSKRVFDLISSPDFAKYGIIKAGEKAGRRLYFQEADQGHIPCPREGLGEPSQVVVKNFLYWMAHTSRIDNAIIAFDTESEIFFTLPCPNYELGDPSTPNNFPIAFSGMRLFEMEGRLTCWFLGVEFGCVWFLDDIDDENRSNIPNWTLKCHLNLSRDFSEYPFYSSNSGIRLLRYQNKELLLVWGGRGVFRYNLSTWKVKKVEEFNRIYYSQDNIDLVAMGHTKSVVFLDDQVRGRCIYFERPDRSHWLEDEVKQD
ncbi:hypothetical protein COLO4_10475 [Corchorus olitorius]|uniref:F-box domain-containing protein n=1 Tax=Corchorus olitorius TaxID=93759 RepID=A0A1R3K8E8_9ROSI|nr:hypothetical protein COLO4_10475 [Corchorus olitorius]